MNVMQISACVITWNEAKLIERCLKSLAFADEIVVVDAHSADGTGDLAKAQGAKVITADWQGFTAQRNRALQAAQGDWVFFLDADEEASPALAQELRRIAAEDPQKHPGCYSIKRVEYFLGRALEYGPGNPSYQWRFFKRKGVKFEGEVHEYPRFEGPVGIIEAPLHHWPSLGIEKFLSKMNHYTSIEALDRFAQGQRTSLAHAVLTFFSTFFKNGIRYQSLRNGKEGFVLTLLESFSRTVRHLKLWVLWQVYEGRLKMDLGVTLPKPGSAQAPTTEELEKPLWRAP